MVNSALIVAHNISTLESQLIKFQQRILPIPDLTHVKELTIENFGRATEIFASHIEAALSR